MRQKRLKFSAVLLLGLGLTGLQSQTMYVRESNDSQTAYALSNVRKLTFSGGNAIIQKTDNSTGIYALSGLRYLNFIDLATIVEPPMQRTVCLLTYPNPVADVLNIDLSGEKNKGTISILTLEGKVIQTQHTSCKSLVTLNLSHLPQGIYLCRYQNELDIKTVKIIKQ